MEMLGWLDKSHDMDVVPEPGKPNITARKGQEAKGLALPRQHILERIWNQKKWGFVGQFFLFPKDHWTLKTGYFEDPTPAIQVQTLPLEGPRSLGLAETNKQRNQQKGKKKWWI